MVLETRLEPRLEPLLEPRHQATPMGMYGGVGLGLQGLPALRGLPTPPPQAMSQLFHASQFAASRGFPMNLGAFGFPPGLLAPQGMRFGPLSGSSAGMMPAGGGCGPGSPPVNHGGRPSGAPLDRRPWIRDQRPSSEDAADKSGDAG